MSARSWIGSAERLLAALQARWGPLSRRTIWILERAGITPDRLPGMTDRQLRIRGLGPSAISEICGAYPAPNALADERRESA